MKRKTLALALLIPLAVIDAVIPVPILGLLLLYVVLSQPRWFWDLVRDLYGQP